VAGVCSRRFGPGSRRIEWTSRSNPVREEITRSGRGNKARLLRRALSAVKGWQRVGGSESGLHSSDGRLDIGFQQPENSGRGACRWSECLCAGSYPCGG